MLYAGVRAYSARGGGREGHGSQRITGQVMRREKVFLFLFWRVDEKVAGFWGFHFHLVLRRRDILFYKIHILILLNAIM